MICNEAGVPAITISPIRTAFVPMLPVGPVTLMAPPLVFKLRSELPKPITFPARVIFPAEPPSKVVVASTRFKLPVMSIPDWVSTLTEVSFRS